MPRSGPSSWPGIFPACITSSRTSIIKLLVGRLSVGMSFGHVERVDGSLVCQVLHLPSAPDGEETALALVLLGLFCGPQRPDCILDAVGFEDDTDRDLICMVPDPFEVGQQVDPSPFARPMSFDG
jgi:hypothetical protein